MKQKKLHTAVRYALTGLTLFTTSLLVQAQEVTEETTEAKDLERIAVVGARGAPRSVTSSPVPVDVLTAEDVEAVAFTGTSSFRLFFA